MITLILPSIAFYAKSTKIINCWIVNRWKDESLRIVGKTVLEYIFGKSHKMIQAVETNSMPEIVFTRQNLNTIKGVLYILCMLYVNDFHVK